MTEKVYYIVVYTVQFDVVVDIFYLQQIISYKKDVIKRMFLSRLCGNDEEESVKVGHANHFAVVCETFLEDAVEEHRSQRTSAVSGEKRKHHETKLLQRQRRILFI